MNDTAVVSHYIESRRQCISDSPTWKHVLALWGIPFIASREAQTRVWFKRRDVFVRGLHVVQMTREEGTTFPTDASSREEHTTFGRQASAIAIRCAYALGLCAAVVTVQVHPQHMQQVAVFAISPMFSAEFSASGAIHADDFSIPHHTNGFHPYTAHIRWGADVEFLLRRRHTDGTLGQIVPACHYFAKKGPIGCDTIRVGDRRLDAIVELRPQPAPTAVALFDRVHASLLSIAQHMDDPTIAWVSGGMPVQGIALGGHIHLSGVPLTVSLLRVLDNYVALPLLMIEGEQTQRRRPKYGVLGDFRCKAHGGFEYRTLPSWIGCPDIARGVLALVEVAVVHAAHLHARPLGDVAMQQAYYGGDKQTLWLPVTRIWRELTTMPTFMQYADILSRLWQTIRRKSGIDEQQDMRHTWKI